MDKMRLEYLEQKRKKATKKVISLIVIIVVIILPIAISGKRIQLKIKKSSMDSKVEAYYVEVDEKIKKVRRNSRLYKYSAIYLYEVNGEHYRYCTPYYNITDISQISQMKKETTIYYDSNNPNNSVSEFELKAFGVF